MTIKKALFFAFAAVIVFIPVYVALSTQTVLNSGKLYKFKMMGDDPFEPFEGKYLRVNYETTNIPTQFDFEEGQTAYVSIDVNKEGFAFFEEAFKFPPKGKDYVKAKVEWAGVDPKLQREIEKAIESDDFDFASIGSSGLINIDVPDKMSKYFISEDDAMGAETVLYKEHDMTYIGVRVLDGEARLEDIYVFDQPILEYLDAK